MEKHPDRPDPEFTGDMEKDIENIKNWSYYDNYQHGEYRDETMDGYGPVRFMNSLIVIRDVELFHGDISKKRYGFLRRFSGTYNRGIIIRSELGGTVGVIKAPLNDPHRPSSSVL